MECLSCVSGWRSAAPGQPHSTLTSGRSPLSFSSALNCFSWSLYRGGMQGERGAPVQTAGYARTVHCPSPVFMNPHTLTPVLLKL